jgi:hypothetical protein
MSIYIYIALALASLGVIYLVVANTLAKIFFNNASMFEDLDWSDED